MTTSIEACPLDATARTFARDGFVILRNALAGSTIDQLRSECEPLLAAEQGRRPGIRRVLAHIPTLAQLVRSGGLSAFCTALGAPHARVVRSILFDKSPSANWLVPWHQDATIAVRARADMEGFGPWSIKDGEHHCRPPRSILDRLFALRLHLDDNDANNGPLRVIPGSHSQGLLPESEFAFRASHADVVECVVTSGDIVAMRPHVLHSSAKSTSSARRRVLHLEFCDAELPAPLEWAERIS